MLTRKEINKRAYEKRKALGLVSYGKLDRVKKPEVHLLYQAKRRSKDYHLEFNITKEDIIIPEVCPILGIPLFSSDGKRTNNSPSLDRIDNSKGYIKGNVAVISFKANRYKTDMDLETIEKLRSYIISNTLRTI